MRSEAADFTPSAPLDFTKRPVIPGEYRAAVVKGWWWCGGGEGKKRTQSTFLTRSWGSRAGSPPWKDPGRGGGGSRQGGRENVSFPAVFDMFSNLRPDYFPRNTCCSLPSCASNDAVSASVEAADDAFSLALVAQAATGSTCIS